MIEEAYILREILRVDLTNFTPTEQENYRRGGRGAINYYLTKVIEEKEKVMGPLTAILKHDDGVYLYSRILSASQVYSDLYREFK